MGLVEWSKVAAKNKEHTIDGAEATSNTALNVLAKRPDKLQLILARCRDNASPFHFVSDGSWSMHDFLLGIIDDYPQAKVWLSTYAITETSARILCDLQHQGKISKLNILGDYRIKDRYPAVEQLLQSNATLRGTQIHGKVLVINAQDQYLTVLGSANWTTNPRIELGVIDQSADVANFHSEWITTKMNGGDVFE